MFKYWKYFFVLGLIKKGIILIFILPKFSNAQSSISKEYSKDIALYRAKNFLIENVLEPSEKYKKLYIDPLAASKSSEITSIYYSGSNKKGLLLGFFDEFSTQFDLSTSYQGYAFKNLPYEEAIDLLNTIERIIKEEKDYLLADDNENNIFFKKYDLTVVIYREYALSGRIRIFWGNFDGEWENKAFRRTKRRLERSL